MAAIAFVLSMIAFTIPAVWIFRKHLKEHIGSFYLIMSVVVSISSFIALLFVVIENPSVLAQPNPQPATTGRAVVSISGVGIGNLLNYLFWLNLVNMLIALLLNSFSHKDPSQRSRLLVDLVGAWKQTNIDNSIEELVNHGIREPQDRDWVLSSLSILKNYDWRNFDKASPQASTEASPQVGETPSQAQEEATGAPRDLAPVRERKVR